MVHENGGASAADKTFQLEYNLNSGGWNDVTGASSVIKAVDSEVQDKIFRNMSKRAATLLKEDMEYMGPVRLKDVEESQQKIVSIIRKLEEQGEIVVARAGEEEMVV